MTVAVPVVDLEGLSREWELHGTAARQTVAHNVSLYR